MKNIFSKITLDKSFELETYEEGSRPIKINISPSNILNHQNDINIVMYIVNTYTLRISHDKNYSWDND